jgi:polyisoprenoid-binding protein YceI
MQLRNRRTLIGAGAAGAVALAAIAVAIVYFVIFPSSSPEKLALGSTTPTPSASASPGSEPSAAPGTWTVASGSQAGYRVREQLAFLGAPSDAVGRTSSVQGTVTISQSGSSYTVSAGSFTVDVNALTSDQNMRDRRIKTMGLESNRYPQSTFVLTTPISLASDASSGQTIHLSATGQLTLHGVTKTVTIPIDARLDGTQIEVVGSITFPFSDFGMTPPSIAGFVSVQNNATMEFDLKLARQGV